MIPKDDTEKWIAIEHRALEDLRHAGGEWRGVGIFSQVFCFLIMPSFSMATAYSFSVRGEPIGGTSYFCVRTKWDRSYDGERFESSLRTKSDMEPTLDKILVKLSDDFARSILDQIQEMSVPLFVVRQGIQLDGTATNFPICRLG